MKKSAVQCDPKIVEEFDYSKLSDDFGKLSKPAKRALVTAGIFTAKQLSKKSLDEVSKLHGMGPGSFPILKQALKANGLNFKK